MTNPSHVCQTQLGHIGMRKILSSSAPDQPLWKLVPDRLGWEILDRNALTSFRDGQSIV